MMEEEKTTQPDGQAPETAVEEASTDAASESCGAEEEVVPAFTARERRGRLIVAGLAAATVATLVAVLVAGIFQFTTKWLTQCPRDRTANGPAVVLWQDVISDNTASRPLGVPKELLETTQLKPPAAVSQESSEGKNEKQ